MIIKAENISYTYPKGKRKILDDISFSLNDGEIVSVLGVNGSGKTTFLNCLATLITPDEGNIFIGGRNAKSLKSKEIASLIGYVPQTHTPSFPYTVFNFVLMGRAPKIGMFERPKEKDIEITERIIEEMDLSHLKDRPYTEISGGERQKATIARALVSEPKAILFDEPTAHLDYGNQLRTLKVIKKLSEKGYAVVMTTHNPDYAIMLGGNTAVLSCDGRLTKGRSSEILTEEKLREIYNVPISLTYLESVHRNICVPPNLV